jgi:hypothetical protein
MSSDNEQNEQGDEVRHLQRGVMQRQFHARAQAYAIEKLADEMVDVGGVDWDRLKAGTQKVYGGDPPTCAVTITLKIEKWVTTEDLGISPDQ